MVATLIKNATLINEESTSQGVAVLIEDEYIVQVFSAGERLPEADIVIDAAGALLLPGVIDEHVHFREPGVTHKATIATESSAAAAGGVTSYFDMPNTLPTTTTVEAWEEKQRLMALHSRVNYSCFFGATNDNAAILPTLDKQRICGVKLFMGSSTGNMLVDQEDALRSVFEQSPIPIMAHCEDTPTINANAQAHKAQYGEDPDIKYHPIIRSAEACYLSSTLGVNLAREAGATFHIAHISTARELELFSPHDEHIIGEACLPHLIFDEDDYNTLGAKIKCNPAIKTRQDRDELRRALSDGRIRTVGTDHAPHLPEEKVGGALKATSGFPMVQFSLPLMLDLAREGVLTRERVVRLMCHNPALVYAIDKRGFIRPGYKADCVLVREEDWTVSTSIIESQCKWSPIEGRTLHHKVWKTFCNGQLVYDVEGGVRHEVRGQSLRFNR